MKIYTGPLSVFGAKAEMAAIEKGVAHEVVLVPFSLQGFYEPKHPDVSRINPKAQIPVLSDGDLDIFDSTQIFEYLEDVAPEPPLWPREPRARARARLLELGSDEIFMPSVVQLFPHNRARDGAEKVEAARQVIAAYHADMNAALSDREFLAGPLTFADLAFAPALFLASVVGAPPDPSLGALTAWRGRMNERTSVRTAVGRMARFLRDNGFEHPAFLPLLDAA